MVFRHENGVSTIAGKPISSPPQPIQQPLRDGHHRVLTVEQIRKRHPADPLPSVSSFANEPVAFRISKGCELKTWVESKLDDMVPLADEETWLALQLREPELESHPMRKDAMKRLEEMRWQISELAMDAAFMEAHADRIWQSLGADDRDLMAQKWVADVSDERIVMNTWTRIAQVGFAWPQNYCVHREWFADLAPPLVLDMKERGLMDDIRLGPQVDPFRSEEEHTS